VRPLSFLDICRPFSFSLRFHAGAQPITAVKKSVLSKNDVEAAIEEYMNDEETESDGEDGEDDN
jgi:hypothetical protein